MTNLNIGCGHVYYEGWVNLDANPDVKCDVVATVPPLPFEDNYFDQILMSHFLEHVPDTIEMMNECWRVMKPGGLLQIQVPYAMSHAAYQDPTHVKFFVPESAIYYTEQMAYLKYPIKVWSQGRGWLQSNGWVVEMEFRK